MARFVDREAELAALRGRLAGTASLSLIYGQRRTGKTFLLQHLLAGDAELRHRLPLHVVLCGSALGTLGRLGDAGQPLHGRFDLRPKLRPFGDRQAAEFAPGWPTAERFRLYGVFGGLARHLKELLELEVLRREVRFGDRSGSKYVRYRCTDPFTTFWFRHLRPNRGALVGTPPERLWAERIAPHLDGHLGFVFEGSARSRRPATCSSSAPSRRRKK